MQKMAQVVAAVTWQGPDNGDRLALVEILKATAPGRRAELYPPSAQGDRDTLLIVVAHRRLSFLSRVPQRWRQPPRLVTSHHPRRWCRNHEDQAAPVPNSPVAAASKMSLEEEVRRLRRENERLRQEREILKKR